MEHAAVYCLNLVKLELYSNICSVFEHMPSLKKKTQSNNLEDSMHVYNFQDYVVIQKVY